MGSAGVLLRSEVGLGQRLTHPLCLVDLRRAIREAEIRLGTDAAR